MSEPYKGKLVAFEGVDGSGKSTQILRAADYLGGLGIPVTTLREPTSGQYGKALRAFINSGKRCFITELSLFLLDRVEDVRDNIMPALDRGDVVLIDRYYPSNMAYQCDGKPGQMQMIQTLNEVFAPVPNITLWLDVPVDVALARIVKGRESADGFEKADFLKQVAGAYHEMSGVHKVRIDASGTEVEVHESVQNVLLCMVVPHYHAAYHPIVQKAIAAS